MIKNIYILSTDKPSRLYFNVNDKEFQICEIEKPFTILKQNKNIYITSDEKITEKDWFILDMSHSTHPNELHQMGNNNWSKTGGIHFCEGNSWIKSCKKIILTTDQELINDNVQAIDDEFLEWFVKNSNCESVKIENVPDFIYEANHSCYKITIPKEKSFNSKKRLKEIQLKQFNTCEYYKEVGCVKDICDCYILIPEEKPKQETLEEVTERLLDKYSEKFEITKSKYLPFHFHNRNELEELINEVIKWQQERMYSEEEVLDLLKKFAPHIRYNYKSLPDIWKQVVEEWFEQLKKK